MRMAWVTDPHLDHSRHRLQTFYAELREADADAVLITGDISSASLVCDHLTKLVKAIDRPIYFVLGNHDFYHGSIDEVRGRVRETCRKADQLYYLPDCDPVPIGDCCLVGADGWGDTGYGLFLSPNAAWLADYDLIAELACTRDKKQLQAKLRALGRAEARVVRGRLKKAVEVANHVVFATHVPPFVEATWHEGKHSDKFFTPSFGCKAVGDVLIEFAEQHATVQFTVLCGHSHGEGRAQILPNLSTWTARSIYGKPAVRTVLEYPEDNE